MPGGCFLDTIHVVSYFNPVTNSDQEAHFTDDEYEQFLTRWGFDHYDAWYILRTYSVHAKDCTYSGCTWQAVDVKQPTG